jgi:hypothetical protein
MNQNKNRSILCVLRVLRGEFFLFLAVWLILLLAGRDAMLRDPGSFWHVAAGERMLETGQVIRNDPFSFTFAGRPWVADQWLAECGMAAIHRLAGWDGLLLLTATLLATIYAWIAARLLHGGSHWLPTCLLLALIVLVGSPQFHVRPLVLTIGLLGVTFAWLVDVEASKKRLRQLWWLVPVMIAWANLHGGVLAGLGTVGLCFAGWWMTRGLAGGLARRVFNDQETRRVNSPAKQIDNIAVLLTTRDIVGLMALLIALFAATLVNPYGFGLPQEWLETLTMPLPSLIDEHTRLSLTTPVGCAVLMLAVIYTAVLVGVWPRRPRVTWLIPLVWFVLASLRVRNTPLFGVTAAIAMADMLPYSRVGQWLVRREMLGSPRPSAGWRSVVMPLIVVAAAVVVQVAGVNAPLIGRGWARFDPAHWPVGLLPQLDDINRANADGAPIFNDLNFGGYLIYHAPHLRVFVDDRCSLYGTDFLQAYDHARRDDPAQLDRWQQQYGFRYALVATDGQFDRHLAQSDAWTLVAQTQAATLYRRRMGLPPAIR